MDLSTPKVMGILNVTPDSFYAKSRVTELDTLHRAEKMLSEGASILDVGGYSSRPGADDVSEEEEIERVKPAIESILKEFPHVIISIDTFRSEVARIGVDHGAKIINDISGGHLDPTIIELAGTLRVPYIAMHMRGTPQNMKELTEYDNLLSEMMDYFLDIKTRVTAAGVNDLVIDPGFGFAKTLKQNYYLLNNVSFLKHLNCPILVGVSRKSMIFKLLEIDSSDALNGTTALNTVALLKGANILRVHDVKEAVQTIKLIGELNDSGI